MRIMKLSPYQTKNIDVVQISTTSLFNQTKEYRLQNDLVSENKTVQIAFTTKIKQTKYNHYHKSTCNYNKRYLGISIDFTLAI